LNAEAFTPTYRCRFDFVRGYAPEYTEEYIRAVLDPADFCVGENWVDMQWEGTTLSYNQDGPRQGA
jgi:alpha-amylase